MKIEKIYSHLNGLEYLQVHLPDVWEEIQGIVRDIDAEKCKTKISKEKNKEGRILYSPKDLNQEFKDRLTAKNWNESITRYYITSNVHLARKTLTLSREEQKEIIESNGEVAFPAYNQTDFVKNRIAIEVQFGKYSFVAYDLFVKHMAFYIRDEIDVGIEILPMKSLQLQMSSGVGCYEGEVYNVIRQGRNSPAVPLIIIGISQ